VAGAAVEQRERDLALVDLLGAQLRRAWGAVGREDRGPPEAPEVARIRTDGLVV
jgi:hypothetical protein